MIEFGGRWDPILDRDEEMTLNELVLGYILYPDPRLTKLACSFMTVVFRAQGYPRAQPVATCMIPTPHASVAGGSVLRIDGGA